VKKGMAKEYDRLKKMRVCGRRWILISNVVASDVRI